jgi:iron complex outermembrane recepter protein
MRILVALATTCLCTVALAATSIAQAALRKPTDIPAEELQLALQALARDRDFQLVYRSELVSGRQSHGAHGELTMSEALAQVLDGTGLTYSYLEDKAITILPIPSAPTTRTSYAPPYTPEAQSTPAAANEDRASPRGKVGRSFWERFRLAQADQGRSAGVDSGVNTRESESSAPGARGSGAKLEEVVVTAQRREQRIEEVPVAVTALSDEALQARRINSSEDLAESLPGLVNVSNQTSGSFAIRGQGPSFGSAPGAYVYFAEVPMLSIPTNTEPSGIDTRPGTFFDMASVELLKGPQGTLFGRNATGGNILFVPRRPDNQLEGYVQGQVGDYADRALEGAVNVPVINDTLLVRVSGALETRDGFVTDVGPIFRGKDYENLDYGTGRLSVLYTPTAKLEEYFIARYYESRDHGPAFVEAAIAPNTPAGINTLFPGRIPDFNQQLAVGPRQVAYDSNVFDRMQYWQFINTLTYRFTDRLRLKNILSDADSAESLGLDVDASPNPILNQTNAYRRTPHAHIATGELQLQGDAFGDHLDYTFGGYADRGYINHRTYDFAFYPFVPGNGPLGQLPVGVPAVPGYPLVLDLNGETRSKALYGQATFNFGALIPVLEGLKLTGGYRYTWEDGDAFQQLITAAGPSGSPGSWRNSYGSYNGTLGYQLSRSTLFYASVRDAYKSGGVNVQLAATDPDRFYQPEHLVSREIGMKTEGAWGPVAARVDIDGFFSNYQNIQRSVVDTTRAVAAFTTNVARAHINGLEANATVTFGPRLELTENYAYTASGYDRITNPAAIAILMGANLPFVAKTKTVTSGTLFILNGSPAGDLSVTTSYSYQGRTSLSQTNAVGLLGPWNPSISLWTVSAAWTEANGGPLSARLFINNAANALYRIGTYDFSTTMGFVSNRYGPPRTFGVQLRYTY